jgi:hypothetical protein
MTQAQEILQYINLHGSITPLDALRELGCFRLAARIYDLEQEGYVFPRETVKAKGVRTGKVVRFTRYKRPSTVPAERTLFPACAL